MPGHDKKPEILIISDQFPYGEESFFLPEVEALNHSFNVSICSLAPLNIFTRDKSRVALRLNGTKVFRIELSIKKRLVKTVAQLCKAPFSRVFKEEIKKCLFSKEHKWKKTRAAITSWVYSDLIITGLEKCAIRPPAIVYTFWYHHATLAVLRMRETQPAWANVSVVTRTHGYDLYEERGFTAVSFKEWMNDRVSRIYFVSEHGEDYFLNRYQIEDDITKYRVLYMGSRAPLAKEKNRRKEEAFCIVSCSRVIPLKRIDLIIEAIAFLAIKSGEQIKWTHFGDGEAFESCKKKAHFMLDSIPSIRYEFMGSVSNDAIHNWYATEKVDVFVNASSSEGAPVSIMEAMSYGIIIVATDVGGTRELVDDNGYLLTANPTPEEIGDVLLQVALSETEVVQSMQKRTRRKWENLFNANKNAECLSREMLTLLH